MDDYVVKLRPEVYEMLDVIYTNICFRSIDDAAADQIITAIEKSILSLETLPNRGSIITTGIYANKGYRQLLVKNFQIIYKVFEQAGEVVVVFVKHEKMEV